VRQPGSGRRSCRQRRSAAITEPAAGLDLGAATRTGAAEGHPAFAAESCLMAVLGPAPGTLHARDPPLGSPGRFAAPDERAEISRGLLGGQGRPSGRRPDVRELAIAGVAIGHSRSSPLAVEEAPRLGQGEGSGGWGWTERRPQGQPQRGDAPSACQAVRATRPSGTTASRRSPRRRAPAVSSGRSPGASWCAAAEARTSRGSG